MVSDMLRPSPLRAPLLAAARVDTGKGANQGESNMYKALMLAGAAAIGFAILSTDVHAQGTPQTVELVKVDVQSLGGSYRASKVIGSSVLNDSQETIGQIEEVLVSSNGKQPFAILSIGGFLGMGSHMVAVPYESLKFADNKVTLPGGTKEGLKMLPEFKYTNE
jgi:hypothetical protein